jgi:hypothetical protein
MSWRRQKGWHEVGIPIQGNNPNIHLEQYLKARQAGQQPPDNDFDPTRPPRRSSRVALAAAIVTAVVLGGLILLWASVLR